MEIKAGAEELVEDAEKAREVGEDIRELAGCDSISAGMRRHLEDSLQRLEVVNFSMLRYDRHDAAQNRYTSVGPSSAFWADGFKFDGELQNQGMRHMLLNWQPSIINDNDDSRTRVLKHAILLFRQVNHYLGFVDIPEFADVITKDGGWPHNQGKPVIKRYELARCCYARQPRQVPANAGDLDIVLCRLVDNYIEAKSSAVRMIVTGARNQYILHIRDVWCQAMKAGPKAILDVPPQDITVSASRSLSPPLGVSSVSSLTLATSVSIAFSPAFCRSHVTPHRTCILRHPKCIPTCSAYTAAAFRIPLPLSLPGEPRIRPTCARPSPDLEGQHQRQTAQLDLLRQNEAEAHEARERAEEAQEAEIRQEFAQIGVFAQSVSSKVDALAMHEGLTADDKPSKDFLGRVKSMERADDTPKAKTEITIIIRLAERAVTCGYHVDRDRASAGRTADWVVESPGSGVKDED
ncbi:hypothetical protein GE09DRAFT_1232226 [Coniochaeta sp. 2T2.1]|nr:hypothetical protein GE09DRAFT_1232226 [Coniochaeta sp. 2T2.1]